MTRILIVDDDQKMILLQQHFLKSLGYELEVANKRLCGSIKNFSGAFWPSLDQFPCAWFKEEIILWDRGGPRTRSFLG